MVCRASAGRRAAVRVPVLVVQSDLASDPVFEDCRLPSNKPLKLTVGKRRLPEPFPRRYASGRRRLQRPR